MFVPLERFELSSLLANDPKSFVSSSSTTEALCGVGGSRTHNQVIAKDLYELLVYLPHLCRFYPSLRYVLSSNDGYFRHLVAEVGIEPITL